MGISETAGDEMEQSDLVSDGSGSTSQKAPCGTRSRLSQTTNEACELCVFDPRSPPLGRVWRCV